MRRSVALVSAGLLFACLASAPISVAEGTPDPSPTASPTPFESIDSAVTGTPARSIELVEGDTLPPTNTGGNGSSNGSGPGFGLLICVTAAGLGLAAVANEQSSVRKRARRR